MVRMSNIFDIHHGLQVRTADRDERNSIMRTQLFVSLLTPLLALTPALGQNQSAASAQRVQVHSGFQFDLNVPLAQAAPLFGPEGERCWAGGNWDPHFVYPQPAHDQQDAVFTVAHGPYTMTWINTL